MADREIAPDVLLSTKRIIRHRRMANGAQQGYIVGNESAGMSEAEYSEYLEARGFGKPKKVLRT